MGFILDIILLLIACSTIITCYRRGFVRSLWETGKTSVSFVCAWLFRKSIGEFIAVKFLDKWLTKLIFNNFARQDISDASSLTYEISEPLKKLMKVCGADADEIISGAISSNETVYDAAESIALPISAVISNLLGFVVAFIVVYFILWLVVILLDKVVSLPILNGVNRFLGACFGVACAAIFVIMCVFVVKVIAYCCVALGGKGILMKLIDGSRIFNFLSDLRLYVMFS